MTNGTNGRNGIPFDLNIQYNSSLPGSCGLSGSGNSSCIPTPAAGELASPMPVVCTLAIVEYVAWFNDRRLHGSLDDRPPTEFETLYAIQFD